MDNDDYEEYAKHSALSASMQKQNARAYGMEERDMGMMEIQIEVDSIKSEAYHLLRQDKLVEKNGEFGWVSLSDKKQRTLSEWGVDRIMQILNFYINKNTLLSNFDEVQINRLMLRFIQELNNLVLLKYEFLFYEPTFEECKEMILEKLENRKKMKMFSLEILGKDVDEKEIRDKLLVDMEKTLENEINKIRQQVRKEKIRDYGLLIAQLEMIVFSTLNRAYRGEERGSLRRHMNVSELLGNQRGTPQKAEKGGIFAWGRK